MNNINFVCHELFGNTKTNKFISILSVYNMYAHIFVCKRAGSCPVNEN